MSGSHGEGSQGSFRARYGPWALVAGASVGLGAEFADQLAARGLNLMLVARREKELDERADRIVAEWGVEVRRLQLDLASPNFGEEIEEAIREIEVGLLVYNAAFSLIGSFYDQPLDQHLVEIDVNCRGPLELTYRLGRKMVERGRGGIILMSSMSGFQGSPLIANYAATKAYNLVLAEGLWDEVRGRGVDVLACCAGATRTPNYEASNPIDAGTVSVPVMEPRDAVSEALAALGRRGSMVPGRANRMAGWVMQRLFPRKTAVKIMGKNMRSMFPR